jgi:hypothetical protein
VKDYLALSVTLPYHHYFLALVDSTFEKAYKARDSRQVASFDVLPTDTERNYPVIPDNILERVAFPGGKRLDRDGVFFRAGFVSNGKSLLSSSSSLGDGIRLSRIFGRGLTSIMKGFLFSWDGGSCPPPSNTCTPQIDGASSVVCSTRKVPHLGSFQGFLGQS